MSVSVVFRVRFAMRFMGGALTPAVARGPALVVGVPCGLRAPKSGRFHQGAWGIIDTAARVGRCGVAVAAQAWMAAPHSGAGVSTGHGVLSTSTRLAPVGRGVRHWIWFVAQGSLLY